jgi:dUTP pyrophosphatase
MKIKVKVWEGCKYPRFIDKGEWVDLSLREAVKLDAPQAAARHSRTNEYGVVSRVRNVECKVHYLPLGVAVELPEGFEAILAPRSSTAKKFGIICANSFGIIDNSYCGNEDEWKLATIPIRETVIEAGSRICQFRIQLSQKATVWQKIKWLFSSKIELVYVNNLEGNNRSGFGSTGV